MSASHPHITPLTVATFDEVVGASPVPVVVDFSARWCPPCGPTADALDQVAGEQAGRFLATSVDVDEQHDLARRFQVTSMPTLLVLAGGEVLARLVGGRGPARLRQDLDESLPAEVSPTRS
jgi:thioredoxin 1